MLPNIGYGEILLIAIVAIVLFGANKIPDAARALGRSVNAFKAGLRDGTDAPEKRIEEDLAKK
jgi:sec-independent protein translocase protein TatA